MIGLQNLGNILLGLNLETKELLLHQILLRALVIFFVLLVCIRLAGRRFLANHSPLDFLLTFIMASLLSRAINGSAPFFLTIITGLFLVSLYRCLAWLACFSPAFGRWLKGGSQPLVEDGKVHEQILKRHNISLTDLMEDLRLNGNVGHLKDVKLAQFERNGAISVVKKD